MEQKYLIDTNIIIDALGHVMPAEVLAFVAKLPPIISSVSYIEALGWHQATEAQLRPIHNFMNNALIIPIDQAVMVKTVLIRQQKKIGLGDAIIAATALIHNYVLLTRNTSDFKNIQGLSVVNPYLLQ